MKTASRPGVLGLTDRVFAELPQDARTGRADDAVRTAITEVLAQQQPGHPYRQHAARVAKVRESITPAMLVVLNAAAQGLSNADIAQLRGVTAETAKTHACRLYKRLGARNRAHAVAIGFRLGLLNVEEAAGA